MARSRPAGALMSIECAFHGFVPADAESRTSQAGKLWVRLRVGVGKDDAMQWVSVAVFGKAAEAAAEIKKGDRVYCEGAIKLETWRGSDGVEKHGLSVASFKIEKTHQIGRNRPRREDRPKAATTGRARAAASDYAPIGADARPPKGQPAFDDDLPF
jgi:single-stranded DNA-binding protein